MWWLSHHRGCAWQAQQTGRSNDVSGKGKKIKDIETIQTWGPCREPNTEETRA
jgi:hypothetical protein